MFKRRNKPPILSRVANFFWPRAGLKRSIQYIWHRIARITGSAHFITIGVVSGVFASWTPFVGFHFILAALIALVLRGSLLASAIGTFFGNPFTFPFIWISTYNIGGFLLGLDAKSEIDLSLPDGTMMLIFTNPVLFAETMWGAIGPYFVPMLIGSLPPGIFTGVVFYFLLRPIITKYKERRRVKFEALAKDRQEKRSRNPNTGNQSGNQSSTAS